MGQIANQIIIDAVFKFINKYKSKNNDIKQIKEKPKKNKAHQ